MEFGINVGSMNTLSIYKIITITGLVLISISQVTFAQSEIGDGFITNAISKQSLNAWQREIATKDKKDIEDYLLLLPKRLLEAETPIRDDSKDFRLKSATGSRGRTNKKAGFLTASPNARITMALFKDRVSNKDIIAVVVGCGAPPIQYCDYGFLEFNSTTQLWKINGDVFPWSQFNKQCKAIEAKRNAADKKSGEKSEYFIPNIVLPEVGTTINVVDAWDSSTPEFKITWNGQKFEIK
jgi:hypothetical protein